MSNNLRVIARAFISLKNRFALRGGFVGYPIYSLPA